MPRPASETKPATGTIATVTRSAERAWRPEIQGLPSCWWPPTISGLVVYRAVSMSSC